MKNILRKIFSFFISLFPEHVLARLYRRITSIGILKKIVQNIVIFFIPKEIKLGNYFLALNQKDAVVSGSIALSAYEQFETEIFKQSLRKDMVVVDIGANIGYYTLIAAAESKQVIAFEPDVDNYQLLINNIEKNGLQNISAYQLAVGEKKGKISFFVNQDNFGDRRIYNFDESGSKTEVDVVSLDEFILENNLPKIDLLKIDIEGAEAIAFKGMKNILNQEHLQMFVEFFPDGLKRTGFDPISFLKDIANFGFTIFDIDSDHHKLTEIKDFQSYPNTFVKLEYGNLYCKK